MAFASPQWEVRTGGNDANGGGFDTGAGNTFPTDGAATSATGSTPLFSSASYNFVSGDIGAWVFIRSGTNWIPGWYKITAVSSNKATLDAAVGHCPLFMSASAPSVFGPPNITVGCATTASPGSATWGVDYSQQDSPQITFTDMVIDGTTNTKFTSSAFPVGKNYIGNIINVTSGLGFTVQRVVVKSTVTTTATCDKSLGTLGSTGGNGKLGGGLLSPGFVTTGVLITSTTSIWIQTGAYSITSTTAGVAGGVFASTTQCRFEGYGTYRGDLGTAPVLTASGIATITLISMTNTSTHHLGNLTVDGASLTAIRGVNCTGQLIRKVVAKNCTNTGLLGNATGCVIMDCAATGCATAGSGIDNSGSTFGTIINSVAYANSVPGILTGNQNTAIFCISANNSGATSDGFLAASPVQYYNCVAYLNGRDGFRNTGGADVHYLNCVAESNVGTGFNGTATPTSGYDRSTFRYCAVFGNGTTYTAANVPLEAVARLIIGTSSFFTNAAGYDFSLNQTAGGGALLRGTGYPGVFPNAMGTTGYTDIGIQSQYAASGFGETSHTFVG